MRKRGRRLALACALPEDALLGGARVTMLGRGCVLVEGHCGVVELGVSRIRLRTEDGVVCISGEALTVKELSADAALITGARMDGASYAKRE